MKPKTYWRIMNEYGQNGIDAVKTYIREEHARKNGTMST